MRGHSKHHNSIIQIGHTSQFQKLYPLIYQKERQNKEHFFSPDPGNCNYLLFLNTSFWTQGSGHHKLEVDGYNAAVAGSLGLVEHMVSVTGHDDPMNMN